MDKPIPNRSVFRAAEVCDIARIQPYVLRSWEQEFPTLGVPKAPGGARLYRKTDVEYVLRIKQLVFEEGLTLAGARRRLEEEQAPAAEESLAALVTPEVREKVAHVRQGLRDVLAMLAGRRAAPAVSVADAASDANDEAVARPEPVMESVFASEQESSTAAVDAPGAAPTNASSAPPGDDVSSEPDNANNAVARQDDAVAPGASSTSSEAPVIAAAAAGPAEGTLEGAPAGTRASHAASAKRKRSRGRASTPAGGPSVIE